jgi:hypothetical protein
MNIRWQFKKFLNIDSSTLLHSSSFSKTKHYINMPKAQQKSKPKANKCSRCHRRHLPPTGSKCTREPALEEPDAQPDSDDLETSLGEGTSKGINIMSNPSSESPEAGPSNFIEGEVRNMTSVMIQILNRMDAQEARISDLASKVDGIQSQSANIVVDSVHQVHDAPPLAASKPSNPAYSVHPTLQQFRADASLVATATQQLNNLEEADLGRSLGSQLPSTARSQKRGLARLGGENAPIVQVPWPHDYVLGSGDKRRLYYTDLSWPQFIQGYTTIMEREPLESIVREMVTHLKYLSMEASCHGFDKARALHSSILTDMEDGLYGWLQKEKVSDARKNFVMPSTVLKKV